MLIEAVKRLHPHLHRRPARRGVIDRVRRAGGGGQVSRGEPVDAPPALKAEQAVERAAQRRWRHRVQAPLAVEQREQPIVERGEKRGIAEVGQRFVDQPGEVVGSELLGPEAGEAELDRQRLPLLRSEVGEVSWRLPSAARFVEHQRQGFALGHQTASLPARGRGC